MNILVYSLFKFFNYQIKFRNKREIIFHLLCAGIIKTESIQLTHLHNVALAELGDRHGFQY